MTIANVEMAAAWDGDEGERWAEHAERYEQTSARYRETLLQLVTVLPDDAVLDIGCGNGGTTRDIARLAASGSVLGVDLSARMLERARAAARAEGLTNVRFEQADVQVHPFPGGAFNLAVSSFGAMFFIDPVAAFLNVRTALDDEGRLALLTWRELERNQWVVMLREALGRPLPTDAAARSAGPFALAERAHVERVLADAGFVDVALAEVDHPIRLGSDGDDAFAFVKTMGMTKGLTEDLDEATTATALERLHRTLVDHDTDDGVLFAGAAWLVTAVAGERTS